MGQVLPFAPQARSRPRANGDWTREERARLDALRRRFARAGVRVEVVYGATEDGDPWCVVMDEQEEVLVHVARIGAVFVVHHALDDALREGADLRDVLAERLAEEGVHDGVVIPFSRAQNLLALIVAAAFFYETAGAEPPSGPMIEPQADEAAPQAVAAAEGHALPVEAQAAPHAETAATAHPLELAPAAPVWRSLALDGDTPSLLGGHGWAEMARASAPVAAPVLGLIGAAAPQLAAAAPPPAFEPATAGLVARAVTSQASTGTTGATPGGINTFARHPQPTDPQKPEPDPQPDPRPSDHGDPGVEPSKPDPAPVDHGSHHEALMSVGQSLFHPALA